MTLSAEFEAILRGDGFEEVGAFSLDETGTMVCALGTGRALDATFSIYAFVGVNKGGSFLRIGKSNERAVRKRILEYPRYLRDAQDLRLGKNGYWAGGTKPWERDGWFGYLRDFGSGSIYVKVVAPAADPLSTETQVRAVEGALIAKHRPPFCNDSMGGKLLRQAWEDENGKAIKHYKNVRPEAA